MPDKKPTPKPTPVQKPSEGDKFIRSLPKQPKPKDPTPKK